ncbi:MAG: cupin domain-containing protein [Pseudomonadota bacterium]
MRSVVVSLTLAMLLLAGSAIATEARPVSKSYVVKSGKGQKRIHAKGAQVEFLASPRLQKNKNVFLSRLTLPAKGRVPEHRDPTEEYLYVLSGSGTLKLDGKPHTLSAGDTVYMAENALVSFQAGDSVVEVIQIFAPSGPEEKYSSWEKLVEGK